ncbi:hypothetical protein [Asticcacaulis benevestitus]|nr:hypothetical protein [Asticcacaulis benevestitus]
MYKFQAARSYVRDRVRTVVQGLDAKLSTITFNRETLPMSAAK